MKRRMRSPNRPPVQSWACCCSVLLAVACCCCSGSSSSGVVVAAAAAADAATAALPPELQLHAKGIKRATLAAPEVVALPKGLKPEGLSAGPPGSRGFYAASLDGYVLFVDAAANTTARIGSADVGAGLTGVRYDALTHAVYAAGTASGKVVVFVLQKGSPSAVSRKVLIDLQGGFLNDVAVGRDLVYVSDSSKPFLYTWPRKWDVDVNGGMPLVTRHALGPAFACPTGVLCTNGVSELAPGIAMLAHYTQGNLYAVDVTGSNGSSNKSGTATTKPAITKLALPAVDGKRILADGLAFERPLELGSPATTTTLWLSDNFNNRIHKLAVGVASAALECTVTSPLLRTPTTLAIQGGRLWAMNARLLECPFLLPCSWQPYEIVGSPLTALCQ